MLINDPAVLAEVEAIFAAYEAALLRNDNDTLARMFLDRPDTVRYGLNDVQHGHAEVLAFRASQAPFDRKLDRTVITSYGRDCATAQTQFIRDDAPGRIGRQTQVWVRTEAGWKVAAAHVSMMDA
ncbi:MAG: oxalurate catabolism protein HpxZ [Rhizobium sp.]|nr:oxalurate catabolism protein HpxZ [Rhizobium sp.]